MPGKRVERYENRRVELDQLDRYGNQDFRYGIWDKLSACWYTPPIAYMRSTFEKDVTRLNSDERAKHEKQTTCTVPAQGSLFD